MTQNIEVKEAIERISKSERAAIKVVLQICSQFGYGNISAWVNTAWEAENGMSHGATYPKEVLEYLKITPTGEGE